MNTNTPEVVEWVGHKIARPMPPGGNSPDSNRIRESHSTWNLVSEGSVDNDAKFHLSTIRDMIIKSLEKYRFDCNIPQITICVEEMLTNILRYGFTNLSGSESPATEQDERMSEDVDPQIFTIRVSFQRIMAETSHSIRVCIEAGDQGPNLPKDPDDFIADSCAAIFTNVPAHGRGFTLIKGLCEFEPSEHRISPQKKVMRFERIFTEQSKVEDECA